jgi:hypothetical protein
LTTFSLPAKPGKLTLSDSGFFSPSLFVYAYPTDNHVIFAVNDTETYILGFRLISGKGTAPAFGAVILEHQIFDRSWVSIQNNNIIRMALDCLSIINDHSNNLVVRKKCQTQDSIVLSEFKIPRENDILQPLSQIFITNVNETLLSLRCLNEICYVCKFKLQKLQL